MKNREQYITKRNEYDMLCSAQLALLCGEKCVIAALSAQRRSCPIMNENEDAWQRCCRCIQRWLNEDSN